jgi:hypothetical protein
MTFDRIVRFNLQTKPHMKKSRCTFSGYFHTITIFPIFSRLCVNNISGGVATSKQTLIHLTKTMFSIPECAISQSVLHASKTERGTM